MSWWRIKKQDKAHWLSLYLKYKEVGLFWYLITMLFWQCDVQHNYPQQIVHLLLMLFGRGPANVCLCFQCCHFGWTQQFIQKTIGNDLMSIMWMCIDLDFRPHLGTHKLYNHRRYVQKKPDVILVFCACFFYFWIPDTIHKITFNNRW